MKTQHVFILFLLLALLLSSCGPASSGTQTASSQPGNTPQGGLPTSTLSRPALSPIPGAPPVSSPGAGATSSGGTANSVSPGGGGSQNPPLLPEASLFPSPTPWPTATIFPTSQPSPTATPAPVINVIIPTCDTGFDIFNGLGEVTNAYVTIQNVGGSPANHVLITLSASDEDKPHPNKSYNLESLPSGYEISLKLTVDTKGGEDTSIQVIVSADGGISSQSFKDSCKSRTPDQTTIQAMGPLYTLRKIGQ